MYCTPTPNHSTPFKFELTKVIFRPILKIETRALSANGYPPSVTRSNRWFGRPGGYFFLSAWMNRAIMPTIRIPVWIRSEYVTIVSPPFERSGGQEAPLKKSGELTACRLSVAPLSAYYTIQQDATRPSVSTRAGFMFKYVQGYWKHWTNGNFCYYWVIYLFCGLSKLPSRKPEFQTVDIVWTSLLSHAHGI